MDAGLIRAKPPPPGISVRPSRAPGLHRSRKVQAAFQVLGWWGVVPRTGVDRRAAEAKIHL